MQGNQNYCIFRSQKIKSVQTANFRQDHNTRKKGPALGDKGQSVLKELIIEGTPSATHKGKKFSDFFKEVTAGQTVRKNGVVAFEAILTFSHGAVPPERLREWAEDSLRFLAEVYGKNNLFHISLHLSEETPHIHCLCTCIDERGKLSANNIIRGPAHLRKLQSRYGEYMAKYGLERGKDKRLTRARHQKVKDWYAAGNEAAARLQTYEKIFGTEQEWSLSDRLEFSKVKADIIHSEAPAATSEEIEK